MINIDKQINAIEGNIEKGNISSAILGIGNATDWLGVDDVLDDVICSDWLDEFVANMIDDYGWSRVVMFLRGVGSIEDDFYRINSYGNLENITIEDVKMYFDDFKDAVSIKEECV